MATDQQPLPAQMLAARDILALFTDPSHPYRRGHAGEIEKARQDLVAAIASQDTDDLIDATTEASYFLGFTCRGCGAELDEDRQLRSEYCSRPCWNADNFDGKDL